MHDYKKAGNKEGRSSEKKLTATCKYKTDFYTTRGQDGIKLHFPVGLLQDRGGEGNKKGNFITLSDRPA